MSGDVAIELGQPTPGATVGTVGTVGIAGAAGPEGADVPVIRVVRGNPTPAQLTALTVVLSTAGGTSDVEPVPRTLWTNRSRYARPRPAVGPGGWRASALPR